VQEGLVSLGASLRVALGLHWTVDGALRLGVFVHHFELADQTMTEFRGTRFDALADLPIRGSYWLNDRVGIFLVMATGLAQRGREHYTVDTLIWRRGMLSLTAGMGMAMILPL